MKTSNKPEATVGGVVQNSKGEILLVKSYKWKNRWTIPGGHVEFGELAVDTVRREMREEVGLKVKVTRLLLVQEMLLPKNYHMKTHFVDFDFLCESGSQTVKIDKEEIQDYKWAKPNAALKLNLDLYTRNTLKTLAAGHFMPVELERKLLGR